MKKYLKALLGVLLISSMLCGCGTLDNLTGGKTAKTTQEVIEKYNELEDNNNVHMEIVMDMMFGASAEGFSLEIPMNIKASMDALDKNHGHMTMDMQASILGQSEEMNMEIYTVDDKAYTHDSDEDVWYVGDVKDLEINTVGIEKLQDKFFETATMEYDKSTKTYTVIQSYSDFASSGVLSELQGTSDDLMGSMGMESEVISDLINNAKVVYVFDKDYNLLSVKTEGIEYSGPFEQDGQTADLKFKLAISITYSKHGEIKESDVAVPDSVKSSAIEESSWIGSDDWNWDDDTSFGGFEEDEDIVDDSFGGYDDDSDYTFDDEYNNELRTDLSYGTLQKLPDVFGSYNGVNLTCEGDSWDNIFGADGWTFTSPDNEYSFLVASNPKYGTDVELYLYTEDYDWTEAGYSGVTADAIRTNGVYGYSLDIAYSESSVRPNMTWNGLTFGASAQDIVSVYGEPSYYYEGQSYELYSYSIELTDGHTMELEFSVYKDGDGLLEVSVQKY